MTEAATAPLHSILLVGQLTAAASLAVLLVAALRIPLRRAVGARAAYWLWLMVPTSALTAALPVRRADFALSARLPLPNIASVALNHAWIGLLVWAVGAASMLLLAAQRQRDLMRSLGRLHRLPNGAYLSAAVVGPMLVGAWRPRVVLPADFDRRYTREEGALVLAHEWAHLERGDALHNALAALWLCLCWFNPLMYWAIGWFRLDQELACDSLVLSTTGTARRRYADALLKAQLTADSAAAIPAGCYWLSSHPLKARIATLKHPQPSATRRACGVVLALSLTGLGSYAAWAIQPVPSSPDLPALSRVPAMPAPPLPSKPKCRASSGVPVAQVAHENS